LVLELNGEEGTNPSIAAKPMSSSSRRHACFAPRERVEKIAAVN
jgi:hypothetical protein